MRTSETHLVHPSSGSKSSSVVTILATSSSARVMRARHTSMSSLARRTLHREHVDVEVVALELVEDLLELPHRLRVADRVVAHDASSTTRLVIVPSATSVTRIAPDVTAEPDRITAPVSARVIE